MTVRQIVCDDGVVACLDVNTLQNSAVAHPIFVIPSRRAGHPLYAIHLALSDGVARSQVDYLTVVVAAPTILNITIA